MDAIVCGICTGLFHGKAVSFNPENLGTEEKMAHLRKYRETQYEGLLDAVYKRRGWDKDSIPTIEKMQELGIDLPEVVDVIQWAQGQVNG